MEKLFVYRIVLLCFGVLNTQAEEFQWMQVKNFTLMKQSLPKLIPDYSKFNAPGVFQRGDWNENDVQLPKFQVPRHYDLTVHPTFDIPNDDFHYSGIVDISLEITETTDFLVIHTLELDVVSISLQSPLIPIELIPVNLRRNEELQYLIMEFEREVPPGPEYTLVLEFDAELSTDLFGFYRSDYVDNDGEIQWMGLTQFAAARARQAFPCFDEPALKARFTISIITDFSTVLSNMPEVTREPFVGPNGPTGEVEVEFQTSVVMSTYLVAWVVCDFEQTQTVVAGGYIDVTVWTQPGQVSQGIFARDVAVSSLEHFNRRFRFDYPITKCDMIAIPDFYFGAMENWGLITYADRAILFDPSLHPTSRSDSIARTVSHELAHQWFGNLVTMDWWRGVWLNEGFATFMAPFGVDATFPEWNEMSTFQRTLDTAMNADSVPDSIPIVSEFNTPADLDGVYNTIAYQKGASILHMLSNLLNDFSSDTNAPFWEVIAFYLQRFQYSTSTTEQLLDLLSLASSLPLPVTFQEFAGSWIFSPGFPVLEFVEVEPEEFLVVQDRFFRTVNPDGTTGSYLVPFSYQLENDTRNHFQYFEGVGELAWTNENGWIKGNIGRTGFYRVNYTPAMWDEIFANLERDSNAFDTNSRTGLLHDLFAFALAPQDSSLFNSENVVRALRGTEYMRDGQELEYMPWWAALRGLDGLSLHLIDRNTVQTDLYTNYLRTLLSPLEDYLGWEVDPLRHAEALLREQLLNFAVRHGLPEARIEASRLFREYITTGTLPPRDVISSVFIGAVNDGFEDMFQVYLETSDQEIKDLVLDGLTYSQNPVQIQQLLAATLDGTIPENLQISVISRCAGNTRSSLQVYEFVRENWVQICDRWCDINSIGTLFNAIVGQMNTFAEVNLALVFFLDAGTPMGDGIAMQAFLNARDTAFENVAWMGENREAVLEYLEEENV